MRLRLQDAAIVGIGFVMVGVATAAHGQIEEDHLAAATLLQQNWQAAVKDRPVLDEQARAWIQRTRSSEAKRGYALALMSQGRYREAIVVLADLIGQAPRDSSALRWMAWLAAADAQYAVSLESAQKAARLLPATIGGRGDALFLGQIAGALESLEKGGPTENQMAGHDAAMKAAMPRQLRDAYRQGRLQQIQQVKQQQAVLARIQRDAEANAAIVRRETLQELDVREQQISQRQEDVGRLQANLENQADRMLRDLQQQYAIIADQWNQIYWQAQNRLFDYAWAYNTYSVWRLPYSGWSWRRWRPVAWSWPWGVIGWDPALASLEQQSNVLAWRRDGIVVQEWQTLGALQAERARLAREQRRLRNLKRRAASERLRAQQKPAPEGPEIVLRARMRSLTTQAPLDLNREKQRLLERWGAAAQRPAGAIDF